MEKVDIMDKDKLLLLYPEYSIVYGPYIREDGRKHLVLYSFINNTRKSKTVSYPKALLEIKLGRLLKKNETADHIDEDFTNDNIQNIQLKTRMQNIRKAFENGSLSSEHLIVYNRSKEGREKKSKRMLGNKIASGNKGKPKTERHKAAISMSLKLRHRDYNY